MTTLAWDGKILAADQQATIAGTRVRTKKLFSMPDGSWVAGSGSEQDVLLAIDWLKAILTKPDTEKPDVDNVGLIRVFPNGAAVQYEHALVPMEIRDSFFAQGSGMDPAMAMLRTGHDAIQAVGTAMQVDCKSGMGIDWVNVVTGETGTTRFDIVQQVAPAPAPAERIPTPSNGSSMFDIDAPGPQLSLSSEREPTIREIVYAYYRDRHQLSRGQHYFRAHRIESLNTELGGAGGSS